MSDDARRHLCFDNPFIWETARTIDYPTRAVDGGGRPTSYPLWVFFLWMLLIHEYGSSRKVEEAFEDPLHSPWPQIRAASQQALSDRPDLIPPETPPTRNQFNYALKHHLPANTDVIAASIRHRSQRLATDMDLGTLDAPGSLNQPTPQRVAYGDVTVMAARTKRLRRNARTVNPDTGEITFHRFDPDARRHTTGGGAVVQGLPWAFTHLRGPRRNQQVILAVDPITPDGPAEGHLVVDQYLDAATQLSGLVGYAYDRALRGVHLDRLLKAGHIGLVGLHRAGGKPAERFHGIETHHPRHGEPVDVEIHLVGGQPHIRVFDVDGNPHLRPLQRRRINKRHNTDGTCRMSAEYDVIVDQASGETDGYVRIRLDQTAHDQLAGYNRPEHLRAFPETDPVFTDIQRPLRSSAESANRTIDDHLPRERLHHFGFEKNQLSMLAWQAYRNAQTQAIFAPHHIAGVADSPPLQQTG